MMGYDVKMEYFVIKGIWYQDEVYYTMYQYDMIYQYDQTW